MIINDVNIEISSGFQSGYKLFQGFKPVEIIDNNGNLFIVYFVRRNDHLEKPVPRSNKLVIKIFQVVIRYKFPVFHYQS